MADKFVIVAQGKLIRFSNVWYQRAMEFRSQGKESDYEKAKGLYLKAAELASDLDKLLEKDKELDKAYDKLYS